jgi:hypothetical protein
VNDNANIPAESSHGDRGAPAALNYWNYFTEIEEQFQRRRGSLILLSTLDWALIETWREAGVPIEAVLRGIDAAFDKRDAHPLRRQRRVNGLAWCAQAVMEQAESMREASVGAAPATTTGPSDPGRDDGFSRDRILVHLETCATQYSAANLAMLDAIAPRLRELASQLTAGTLSLEDLERALTMLEEKVFAILLSASPDDTLVLIREQSSRELAPYRRKMQSAQIAQVERQFLNKRLLESHNLPRLSLFYMAHA